MDLTGLTIPDIYGVDRVPLDGEYSSERLAAALVEEWIPYFECHKCGRWDYCKFTQKHPVNPNRSVDIKCGVAVNCINNLINSAYPVLQTFGRDELQNFLDGAFQYFGFIYGAEQWIGMNMDRGFHEYFKEYAPFVYSRVAPLRSHLDKLAYYWKDLPKFKTKAAILLVEGYSEKAFLDELRKSHSSWFLDLELQVYGGKGNRRTKRIQMLLERYKEQGFVIHAQGDADGNYADIFRNLIECGLVEKENTFVFEHDFESGIPISLVHAALVNMEVLEKAEEGDFDATMMAIPGNLSSKLSTAYGVDLGPIKVEFAAEVADILNHSIWWNNESFMEETELGRFLRFIQKM